ncbi:hypothetical protein Tco_0607658 [Tanacetum coccineum]
MTNSVILISSDSSEESVRTSTARVILFGMILTTIPSTAPTVDLPYTSPFICTNSSNSDTPERPPSPDPYEVIVARWRSRVVARSSLPSPHVISDSPCDSLTTTSAGPSRKRHRSATTPVPVASPADIDACIAFVDDIAARWMDVRVEIGNAVEEEAESSARGMIKIGVDRVTHPVVSNDIVELVREDFWSSAVYVIDGLVVWVDNMRLRGMLGVERQRVDHLRHIDVKNSYKPYIEPDIDPDVQENIDACIVFANDIAARGTDVRVEMVTATEEEVESSARGTIETGIDRVTHPFVSNDIVEPVREDFLELVSADGSLEVMQRGLDVVMQDLYDYMMEILVHRVRVIESV